MALSRDDWRVGGISSRPPARSHHRSPIGSEAMEKQADQRRREHAPVVRRGGSYVRAPQFAASTILILAAALSACGDEANPAVMQETPSSTPAPSSNTPATMTPPAMPP